MALDRDLSVSIALALARAGLLGRSGWEMTAATGVRGLRVLHESGWHAHLLSTELRPEAAAVLVQNAARYRAEGAEGRHHDARSVPPEGPFDWVDLDPYGSPLALLPSAFEGVADGGLLTVTATDMIVLAGALRGACDRRYGATSIRGRLGPEAGLRILLATLERMAGERGRHVEPLVSYVGDHHVRVAVRVRAGGPPDSSRVGLVDAAGFDGPKLPNGTRAGPMWLGPLFSPPLVAQLPNPSEPAEPLRLAHLRERFREESQVDRPFAYEPNEIARSLHLRTPPAVNALLEGLRNAGFPAGRSHVHPAAFRTSAPRSEVEALARRLSA